MTDSKISNHRLYLALYSRDGVSSHSQEEDRYHWALLATSTNSDVATRFHARDYFTNANQTHWIYEEIHVSARGTQKLLSKTYIGDIADEERLLEIIRDAPIRQDEEGWNCVSWVREVLEMMWEDGEVLSGELAFWGTEGSELTREALAVADIESARREVMVKALL
jgi:hypothetical protein